MAGLAGASIGVEPAYIRWPADNCQHPIRMRLCFVGLATVELADAGIAALLICRTQWFVIVVGGGKATNTSVKPLILNKP